MLRLARDMIRGSSTMSNNCERETGQLLFFDKQFP